MALKLIFEQYGPKFAFIVVMAHWPYLKIHYVSETLATATGRFGQCTPNYRHN
jgi:hypothetical protein